MRKKIASMALLMAVLFLCSTAIAATDDVLQGMGKKFFRGLANVLTGWMELPTQIIKGYNRGCPLDEDNKIGGMVCGMIKGVGHSIGRTAWGALEAVGFWTANPKDNEGMGIPLDATYVWEEGEAYNCLDPNITEATLKPMGRKFLRGLSNGLFGFAELPGQVAKGIEEKAPDLGIIKGLWFWYSREIYGIADVATVIFPTPADNPGYAFDEEYPWDALAGVIEK